MEWIDEQINEYYKWLKDKTAIRKDNGTGWFAIDTPFIGLFNDNIEIFVKKVSDSEILLSDDGETLSNLSLSGVDISRSPKRKAYLQKIINNHGVRREKDELVITSNGADFARKKHALISAIMSISDMNMLSNENVASVFAEDVMAFADEKGITYTPMFIVRGKSGLDFNFDFQVAGRDTELVIKTFNTLRQNTISSYLFCLNDVRDNREQTTGKKFKSLTVINDITSKPSAKLIEALKAYDTHILLWSEKNMDKNTNAFTAA